LTNPLEGQRYDGTCLLRLFYTFSRHTFCVNGYMFIKKSVNLKKKKKKKWKKKKKKKLKVFLVEKRKKKIKKI